MKRKDKMMGVENEPWKQKEWEWWETGEVKAHGFDPDMVKIASEKAPVVAPFTLHPTSNYESSKCLIQRAKTVISKIIGSKILELTEWGVRIDTELGRVVSVWLEVEWAEVGRGERRGKVKIRLEKPI